MSNVIPFVPPYRTPIGDTVDEMAKTYKRLALIRLQAAIRELQAAKNLWDCSANLLDSKEWP